MFVSIAGSIRSKVTAAQKNPESSPLINFLTASRPATSLLLLVHNCSDNEYASNVSVMSAYGRLFDINEGTNESTNNIPGKRSF